MSVFGSHLASSVAPMSVQAQQAARQRERQDGEATSQTRKVQEMFETHLRGLEEADQFDSTTHLHVDEQLPEHQTDSQSGKKRKSKKQPQSGEAAIDLPATNLSATQQTVNKPSAHGEDPHGQLYRHLDIQA